MTVESPKKASVKRMAYAGVISATISASSSHCCRFTTAVLAAVGLLVSLALFTPSKGRTGDELSYTS